MRGMIILSMPVSFPKTAFQREVLDIVAQIPAGEVWSYKQVAIAVGRPRAYRAVGSILKQNFDPRIPCHRVIRSDGKTGEYNRGATRKIERLKEEGAII